MGVTAGVTTSARPMRADARRNYDRVIVAAREVLRAQLLGLFSRPAAQLVSVLAAPAARIVRVLDARKTQLNPT